MHKLLRDGVEIDINSRLPVLPLKEVVVFPYMTFPLLVGREPSLHAVQEAMRLNRIIFLAAQKDVTKDEPGKDDLHRVGVVARILQMLKLPNGVVKVLVEGLVRARINRFLPITDHYEARVDILGADTPVTPERQALMRRTVALFKDYVHLNRNLPNEVLFAMENIEQPQHLADFVAAHIQRELKTKQHILEIETVEAQFLFIAELLESEIEILEIERNLDDKVRGRIQRTQRNYWLQEQMRAIQEELGDEPEVDNELGKLRETIKQAGMPAEAEAKALEELDKLRHIPPISPEATVIRNYLDWLVAVPWKNHSADTIDLTQAQRLLDEDHYGLEKPKARILEHLAVLKLVNQIKGPILCLVGPPGVGKTSLGKSIAAAMGRNFVRVSLGGVRDEAEIRGHRRTYIGAMPGKIIQSMKRAKTVNPVFLLDEIDKMSMDFRGDPSAALLEVLDPEQNKAFNDHYLDVDYDLSQVLFITTANVRAQIPEPLQDRMEIINLPGYLEHEKLAIAQNFLIPKLLKAHGLETSSIVFEPKAILKMIREYTREAGVRNLERELSTICRKVTKTLVAALESPAPVESPAAKTPDLFDAVAVSAPPAIAKPPLLTVKISVGNLGRYLGVPQFPQRLLADKWAVGSATGMAWTSYGGDILEIQVSLMPGKGDLVLTGKLGEVMKESAKAALTYARTNAARFGITGQFWKDTDIHIHVPEGGIPKDGPSAGITMATALISALSGRQVRRDVAMTGEITLRGSVLGIGGLNEKILAAQRFGIRAVIIPTENAKDLKELPAPLRKGMHLTPVKHIDEVLALVLADKVATEPAPSVESPESALKTKPAALPLRPPAMEPPAVIN
ncbi:MAG: Lon protease 1 [bacterium]|nr:Lon protease 1 [bacterium]